jgi:putative SOS response-associated peptidase YedK
MCGRFVASRPVEELARLLRVDEVDVPAELAAPRWNVAPQSQVLAATAAHHDPRLRRLSAFGWGLVPWWAKDPSIGARAFNAKSETVEDKAMFRGAIARQRCVVPADAFYEWAPAPPHAKAVVAGRALGQSPGEAPSAQHPSAERSRRKQPWCFRAPDSGLLLLAGLFEQWRPRGERFATPLRTCTILTTDANDLVGRVHDRMPVLIAEDDLEEWLCPEPLAPGELNRLTRPARPDALEAFRVSTQVNDAREEGPELAAPVVKDDSALPEGGAQAQLF